MNDDTKPQQGGPKTGSTGEQAMHGAVDQAKQAATQVTGQVRDKIGDQLGAQKDRAVGSISGVADALRDTGKSLRQNDSAMPAEYADRAADQIERIGGYLRDRTLGELVGDVERFARREPAIFVGGAFALGLLAGRFLKSSTSRREGAAAMTGPGARPAQSAAGGGYQKLGDPSRMPPSAPAKGQAPLPAATSPGTRATSGNGSSPSLSGLTGPRTP